MPYGSSFIRSCLSTSGPFLPWIIDWGTTDLGTIWSGFYCHFMDIIFLNLSHIIIKSAPLLLPAHSLLSSHPLRLTASVLRSLRSLRPKASRSVLKGEERESWAEVTRGMKSEPSLTDATRVSDEEGKWQGEGRSQGTTLPTALTTITIIVQFFPAVTNDFLFHIPVTFRLRYGSVVIASRSSFSPTVPVGDGSPPGATLRYACPSGDTERRWV